MKLGWLAVVLVACTKPSSPPAAPVEPPPPPPLSQVPSCDDVGPILRGEVEDEDRAGKDKEALLVQVCERDRWPKAVLACITSRAAPAAKGCLDDLTEVQAASYEEQVGSWREENDDEDDEEIAEEDDYIECEDAIGAVDGWPPPITVAGDDKDLALGLRKPALITRCDGDEWSEEVKACLEERSRPVDQCAAMLEPDQHTAVTSRLAEIDKLVAKASKLRKKAATHTCKQVVATHYSDARWKSKLPHLKGAERKKVIADSRTKLRDACTSESWSPGLRVCLVAGGEDDCFAVANVASGRFGFPASGVAMSIGIPECDEYAEALKKLTSCAALPQESRDALRQAFEQTRASWASAATQSPESRAALAAACKSARDAVLQSAAACGP